MSDSIVINNSTSCLQEREAGELGSLVVKKPLPPGTLLRHMLMLMPTHTC